MDYCKHRHTRRTHPHCFEAVESGLVAPPKVLVLDVECAPMRVFVWNLSKQRISPKNVISDRFLLSWAAKWLYDSKTMSSVLTPEEALAKDDKRLTGEMWKLLDEADIVIAHNGRRFDLPLLNTRFLMHQLPPPMYYQVIDTVAAARGTFAFASNSLGYLNLLLELDGKIEEDYDLWKSCYAGKKKALKEMVSYNRHDVVILEELYTVLRPWIKSHPNIALYYDNGVETCPHCGNTHLIWKGFYYTPAGRFEAFRCSNCGAIGRRRVGDLDKEDRQVLVVS